MIKINYPYLTLMPKHVLILYFMLRCIIMSIYKPFSTWSQVAQNIQLFTTPRTTKPGLVHWCNLGINIGSEIDGKGPRFTRPVVVLFVFNSRLALIAPTTTKKKTGLIHPKIIINGKTEYLLLDQIRTIDTARLENFIDEINSQTMDYILHRMQQAYNHLIKKSAAQND